MATVEFRQATRRYDATPRPAVNRLDLVIGDGEFLVLVGPSGCGKSTTLRMLAGLEPIDEGWVFIDDVDVSDTRARDRDVAMVFQSYALYPNMTARQNMAFALENARMPKDQINRRVEQVAAMLELDDLLDTRPGRMSGGQRQRVAMGRAIVRQPRVFCMDEPLSNLDAKLRVSTRAQIAALQRQLGVTTAYVTHDQTEAMTMGDRVCVLADGVLQQVAAPTELYQNPANTFVAGFIGSPAITLIDGIEADQGHALAGGVDLGLPTELVARCSGALTAGIRPEGWHLVGESEEGIPLGVDLVEHLGAEIFAHCSPLDEALRVRGGRVIIRTDKYQSLRIGSQIRGCPRRDEVIFFDAESGVNLGHLV